MLSLIDDLTAQFGPYTCYTFTGMIGDVVQSVTGDQRVCFLDSLGETVAELQAAMESMIEVEFFALHDFSLFGWLLEPPHNPTAALRMTLFGTSYSWSGEIPVHLVKKLMLGAADLIGDLADSPVPTNAGHV